MYATAAGKQECQQHSSPQKVEQTAEGPGVATLSNSLTQTPMLLNLQSFSNCCTYLDIYEEKYIRVRKRAYVIKHISKSNRYLIMWFACVYSYPKPLRHQHHVTNSCILPTPSPHLGKHPRTTGLGGMEKWTSKERFYPFFTLTDSDLHLLPTWLRKVSDTWRSCQLVLDLPSTELWWWIKAKTQQITNNNKKQPTTNRNGMLHSRSLWICFNQPVPTRRQTHIQHDSAWVCCTRLSISLTFNV